MELGPKGGLEIYKKRRQALSDKIKGGVAVLPASPEYLRNNDVHHAYRQDSNLYYLTGFTEPESVCVLSAAGAKLEFTLFVRAKDPTRELWDGFRYGVEGAQKHFGCDRVHHIDDFEKVMPDLMGGAEKLYYRLHDNRVFDDKILGLLKTVRHAGGRTGRGYLDLVDVGGVLGELRLFKSGHEIELLRKACEITCEGHLAAMRATAPGKWEYEIQAACESEFMRLGSERLGYGSIVGTGANATVLHYVFNRDQLKAGELLLIDAGAEHGYFTGDVTRTYPVNGKFTEPQKRIYNAVLKVQKACIEFVRPGKRLGDVHKFAIEGLVDGMLELGLLKGSLAQIIDEKKFTKYYPHGTGHWLGMDVHDSGLYQLNGESRILEPGMCFTIEPGLYVPADDPGAPKEFRGIGIRIEDDVCVTANGCEVFTTKAPKEVDALEAIIGK